MRHLEIRRFKAGDGSETVAAFPDFDGVERLLSALKPGQIGLIFGTDASEEFSSYAKSIELHRHAEVVSGKSIYSVRNIAYTTTNLYAKYRYKVDSFLCNLAPSVLTYRGPSGNLIRTRDPLEFAKMASKEEMYEFLMVEYIASRRIKEGAKEEFDSYMKGVKAARLDGGSVVMRINSFLTFEKLLSLWQAVNDPAKNKIVLVWDRGESRLSKPFLSVSRERDYIDSAILLESAATFFSRREDVVGMTYKIWSRTLDSSSQKLTSRGKLTESLADRFVGVLAIGTFDDVGGEEHIVPPQRPAPIRFQTTSDGKIDILGTKEHAPEEARILGAIKTCEAALEDLAGYPNVSNCIPNFQIKIRRLSDIISIISSGGYDDNHIVQLGTEVGYLEARIWSAKEQLGETTFSEASSFFALLSGFLSQFSIWQLYKAQISSSGDGVAEAMPAAADILQSVSANGSVATFAARERIGDFMEGVAGESTEVGAQGAVATAENVAAQAAGKVAEFARREGIALSGEVIVKARKKGAEKLVNWFVDNIPHLTKLADVRNIEWLRSFIEGIHKAS